MELLLPDVGLIVWLLFILALLILPLIALVSILKSTFSDSTTKLMWVILVILLPFFGALLYFTLGKKRRLAP